MPKDKEQARKIYNIMDLVYKELLYTGTKMTNNRTYEENNFNNLI
jgi:hypothetical protein